MTARPPRDWIQISVTALPGLAAVIALIFTSLAIRATGTQLQIAEQGQITDRYNAAITNLGSPSVDVRLGGIYALQRIMQDSPRDQPTVIAVLCAFVRDHASTATANPPATPQTSSATSQPSTDVQAALTVVVTRNTAHDGSTTVVDFTRADLSGADLTGAGLSGADLTSADLSGADLTGANLSGANLTDVDFSGASLSSADLTGASFYGAHLIGANLNGANLNGANLNGADLSDADLTEALLVGTDLADADITDANLTRVNLTRADLTRAEIVNVDLSGAALSGADLSRADLSDANLSGANLSAGYDSGEYLSGADLSGAYLSGADLTNANLDGANLDGANLADTRGLRIGTPRPPTGSTPAASATKNLCLLSGASRQNGYLISGSSLAGSGMAACRHYPGQDQGDTGEHSHSDVQITRRGARWAIGPRAARLHLGAGGPGMSTGAGPVPVPVSTAQDDAPPARWADGRRTLVRAPASL